MPVDSGMPAERHDCYAICPPGVEDLTAAELDALRITPGARQAGGVAFQATAAELYAANLHLRTANRVITRLAEFPAKAFYELERKAKRVPWARVLASGRPARFRVTSRKSKLYHLDAIAERRDEVALGPGHATQALIRRASQPSKGLFAAAGVAAIRPSGRCVAHSCHRGVKVRYRPYSRRPAPRFRWA